MSVSQHDLKTAILWLRSYEAEDGDSTKEACLRVAASLEADLQRRKEKQQAGKRIRQFNAGLKKRFEECGWGVDSE